MMSFFNKRFFKFFVFALSVLICFSGVNSNAIISANGKTINENNGETPINNVETPESGDNQVESGENQPYTDENQPTTGETQPETGEDHPASEDSENGGGESSGSDGILLSGEADPAEGCRTDGGRIIFLLYHDIVEKEIPEGVDPAYTTTVDKLESDIISLYRLGFESISCEMYYNGDYDPASDYFVLTFDDGYLSNATLLPDILIKHGAYADVFMCTENTGLPNHFTYSEGKAMEASGRIKLYSHYLRHLYVTEIDSDTFRFDSQTSYEYLEKRLAGERLRIFAYPHGAYNEETAGILRDGGTVMQMVQYLPGVDCGWDYREYGIIRRANVEYTSDIETVVSEYFAAPAGEP